MAEFAEDLETVELQNAKIYHLQPDNQFYTKYFLERVVKTTNYLIYAPFPKPDVKDNHMEDDRKVKMEDENRYCSRQARKQ